MTAGKSTLNLAGTGGKLVFKEVSGNASVVGSRFKRYASRKLENLNTYRSNNQEKVMAQSKTIITESA